MRWKVHEWLYSKQLCKIISTLESVWQALSVDFWYQIYCNFSYTRLSSLRKLMIVSRFLYFILLHWEIFRSVFFASTQGQVNWSKHSLIFECILFTVVSCNILLPEQRDAFLMFFKLSVWHMACGLVSEDRTMWYF